MALAPRLHPDAEHTRIHPLDCVGVPDQAGSARPTRGEAAEVEVMLLTPAASAPDIGLAIIVLGTAALALAVNLGAAWGWLRRRK
jgi:hypothetical protein